MGRTVLVIDDEKKIVEIIAHNLKKQGYDVIRAYDGEEGLEKAMSAGPDLILLDIMMPGLDGYQVCRRIREKSQVPIIMLTARVDEVDKGLGLELGADDYVTKPFSLPELMARVKANLRRTERLPEEAASMVFKDIVIDLGKVEVRRDGETVELTHKEFELLKYMASQPNKVFTREELLERVWGYEYFGDTRNVDVTIRRLRSKVEENPARPCYIMTKRDVGYYFSD
jgi:two-component system response regulator VicR